MTQQTSPRTSEPAPARHARWWSSRRVQAITAVVGGLLLELLPLEAWLIVGAGYAGATASQAAAPLWFLFVLALIAWVVARSARGRPAAALITTSIVPLALAFVILLRISPSAYGDVPGGPFDAQWIAVLVADVAGSSARVTNGTWLLALVVYVWWRGLSVGMNPPMFSAVVRRFQVGMAAVVLGLVATVGTPAPARPEASIDLGGVLLAETFVGLLATALARVGQQRIERGADNSSGSDEGPWLSTAALLAGLIVGAALLLSIIVDLQSLTAAGVSVLLLALGPLGAALDAGVRWLIFAFARLLFWLFNPLVQAIKSRHLTAPQPIQTPTTCQASAQGNSCQTPHPQPLPISPVWTHLASFLLEVVMVLIIALAFIWLMRRLRGQLRFAAAPGIDEERESLDARGLFGAQVRALLSGLRPHRVAQDEPLPPGSVRAIYRDLLRAAAARGIARRSDETPDEFAKRLGQEASPTLSVPELRTDLTALSEAYDAARYAEREPGDSNRAHLRARARHVIGQLQSPARRREG